MKRQQGFTLIEVLIAVAVLGIMMMLAWSTIRGAVEARRNLEVSQERDSEIRVGLARMVRDLSSAYISANEEQGVLERRTMFIGKSEGTVDELRFSSMAHSVLWANANESEQTVITYMSEADPDDRTRTNLVRRELRRPNNDPSGRRDKEPAELDLLVRDVERVKLEYYDWKDKSWKERWDSTQADGERGRLPTRVRITLEIEEEDRDGDKEKVKYVTQARVMLQEELRFYTN
ncbi:MAG TPA: prepilin-type N-terminal cleavage/methylation domain-containing protein [Kofleriaceae bacterium]|nr:prepilin-type N-terminal cleavage/methylation domain-containing protein [Kofleriaceae bacterium]